MSSSDECDEFGLSQAKYKEQYKELKRKLKLLIYVSIGGLISI